MTTESARLVEKTLLMTFNIDAMPMVDAAADADFDCFVFSDSIGLFGPLFFDIVLCNVFTACSNAFVEICLPL